MENTILDSEQIDSEADYRDYLAPKWKRFIHFLVDVYGVQIAFGVFYGLMIETDAEGWEGLLINVYALLVMLTIYFVSENYTGKTLGKLLTGSKVIAIEGGKPSTSQIFSRTLSRIVPFEPLSAFGQAWHDDWSNTAVVNNNFPG